MPLYEHVFLARQDVSQQQVDTLTTEFKQVIEELGGKIAKMLPSSVTKDGKLTVGMDTSYAPAEFLAADGKTPVDILSALFPCGSITGAPKIRAMEIIREVEPFPRGAYCGTLGWMAPDGSGCFSVTIRTLSVWADGRVTLNVGGGVVQDSTADAEWEEALWKSRFAQALMTPA